MKKIFVFLFLLLLTSVVYTEKISILKELLQPDGMAIGNGRIYVTEKTSIYIYSLKDFNLIKKFGEKGEGPNEFRSSFIGQPMVIYPIENDEVWELHTLDVK